VPSGETICSCRQVQIGEAGAQVGQRPVSSNGLARSGREEKEKEEVRLMRRIILLVTLAAVVVVSTLFAVSVAGAHKHPTAKAQKHPTRTVLIKNFHFKPAHITIKRGTKVRWINKDPHPHTATANNGRSFDSGHLDPGERYTHTFKSVGTKKYHCEIHPFMRGRVVVKR
jgi:plastocyanin